MKRILTVLSLLGCASALLLLLVLRTATVPDPLSGATTNDAGSQVPLDSLALDQPRRVEFDVGEEVRGEFSSREWRDQMLDWLLFTAVGAAGLSVEEFDQVLFDRQAVRYGYLRPVGSFEYGDTRSVVIGEDSVLALIPRGADRLEHLAHIADEHRKNLGETPTTVLVHEYALDPEGRAGTLVRRTPVDGRSLFTPEYGYHEAAVGSLADLSQFMERIDALSMARRSGDTLILGGRKLKDGAYRGIGVEEVAALWQAEQRLQARVAAFQARWDSVERDFNARWQERVRSAPEAAAALELRQEEEADLLVRTMALERHTERVVNSTGFSLDPTYDFQALQQYLRQAHRWLHAIAAESTAVITPEDIAAADSGLAEDDANAFLELTGKLMESGRRLDSLVGGALWAKSEEVGFQAARYDGDLQGTGVGMVLFYTDLLAKLWALDFMRSAPDRFIEDFQAMPHLTMSPIYRRQLDSLTNTRLWFGKQDGGFQSAEEGDLLLLARNATRVYAASANQFRPGEESSPNAQSAGFLGWWNDHYEEVARFEPEYQRLNEIMKWSLVLGWLSQEYGFHLLHFLSEVPVDRSNWFPDWVRQHPELRFKDWTEVPFFPRGYKGARTEALPRLISAEYSPFGDDTQWSLSGGVSLASRQVFTERAHLPANVRAVSRRANLDYGEGLVDGRRFRTLDGLAIEREQISRAAWSTGLKPADGAKLRGGTGELATQRLERITTARAAGLEIDVRAESGPIGRLALTKTENGFTVGWRSRDIDRGQSLARRMSSAPNPLTELAADPSVETMIVLAERNAAMVKLSGSERWVMLGLEETPSSEIAAGWNARVAAIRARRNIQVAWLDDAAAQATLDNNGYLAVTAPGGNRTILGQAPGAVPPAGSKSLTIEVDGITLSGQVDPGSSTIYLRIPDLPNGIRADIGQVARLVTPDDLAAIHRIAATDATTITHRIPTSRGLAGDVPLSDLRRGDYQAAARRLVGDPVAFGAGVERHLSENLGRTDRLLAEGRYSQALEVLDNLRDVHGAIPDVTLRKALAELGRGRVREAATALRPTRPVSLRDRNTFFDEINRRLEQEALTETERANLRAVAEYADWVQAEAGRPAARGRVMLGSSDDALSIEYRLQEMPDGVPLGVADLALLADRKASIYVQNSPGLNNLDWSAGLEHSLRQVVSGNLGRVVRLPRGDIAQFKPAVIYGPDRSTRFETVGRPARSTAGPYRIVQEDPCVLQDETEDEESEDCEPVYLVIASSPSR